jgi:putative DNA primase/helicase
VSVFISKRSDRLQPELARLPGVRLVTATEPSAGQAWDEKLIKAITGGDEIETRFLYGQPFTYFPQFKIIIVGNHEPEIRQVDDAMLRRIHIVPLNHKVPREKQVEGLSEILVREEGPQILRWMIEGCLIWQRERDSHRQRASCARRRNMGRKRTCSGSGSHKNVNSRPRPR